jgi:hypothetical protein
MSKKPMQFTVIRNESLIKSRTPPHEMLKLAIGRPSVIQAILAEPDLDRNEAILLAIKLKNIELVQEIYLALDIDFKKRYEGFRLIHEVAEHDGAFQVAEILRALLVEKNK